MSNLARTGHGVKSPYKFSCPDIEGAHSSARSFRRMLLQSRSCDNEVLVDGGRRGCLVRSFRPPVRNVRTKVDCSTIAEALARLAGLRIQSEETRIDWPAAGRIARPTSLRESRQISDALHYVPADVIE